MSKVFFHSPFLNLKKIPLHCSIFGIFDVSIICMGLLHCAPVYINMNALDVETFLDSEGNYVPYCLCFNISSKYYSFYYSLDCDNLIFYAIMQIFGEIPSTVLFYIHNLNFDGAIIMSYLSRVNIFSYKTFLKNMSFYKIEVMWEGKTICLMCSYKLLPLPLSKISLDFTTMEKLPFPYSFSSLANLFYVGPVPNVSYWNNQNDYLRYSAKNNYFDFWRYSIDYCTNDVKITHTFLEKLNEILSNFQIVVSSVYSGPSLSLKIFLKCFNAKKVSFSHSKFYDKILRNAYYGGRCEVYGNPRPDEFILHYDFSGMYAQCMKEKIPFGKYTFKTGSPTSLKPGFYWISFSSNMERPVLPIHDVLDNGKLIFPNGDSLCGFYWFEEIELFLKKGGVINDFLYSLEYSKFDFVFSDYVNFFSSLRDKGPAYSSFGKNMNNFLYGRLGLGEPSEHTFFVQKSHLPYYTNWKKYKIVSFIEINNMCMISVELSDSVRADFKLNSRGFKNNVGIAAAITSKARIKLYGAQDAVLENMGRLLYSDTDSIFAAYVRNPIGETHGPIYWDPVKKDTQVEKGVFINPKTYALKYFGGSEVVKIKGFNNTLANYDQMCDSFYKRENIVQYVATMSKKNFFLRREIVEKILYMNEYNKRIFSQDLKTTEPVVYEQPY